MISFLHFVQTNAPYVLRIRAPQASHNSTLSNCLEGIYFPEFRAEAVTHGDDLSGIVPKPKPF
jgi:hypothetical protein